MSLGLPEAYDSRANTLPSSRNINGIHQQECLIFIDFFLHEYLNKHTHDAVRHPSWFPIDIWIANVGAAVCMARN